MAKKIDISKNALKLLFQYTLVPLGAVCLGAYLKDKFRSVSFGFEIFFIWIACALSLGGAIFGDRILFKKVSSYIYFWSIQVLWAVLALGVAWHMNLNSNQIYLSRFLLGVWTIVAGGLAVLSHKLIYLLEKNNALASSQTKKKSHKR